MTITLDARAPEHDRPAVIELGVPCPDWGGRHACRGLDPDLFFPRCGDNKTAAAAKAVCAGCAVRVECLEFALAAGERYGIWGGTSERERRRMRRERREAVS